MRVCIEQAGNIPWSAAKPKTRQEYAARAPHFFCKQSAAFASTQESDREWPESGHEVGEEGG